MQIDDLILLLIEKTQKKELPWRREGSGKDIQFTLRLDGVNMYLSTCKKQTYLSIYDYRFDSNIFKKEVHRDLYDFVSNWWDTEILPTALEKFMGQVSKCQQSPLVRLEGEEPALMAIPQADNGHQDDWEQPVPHVEVVAAADIEGI